MGVVGQMKKGQKKAYIGRKKHVTNLGNFLNMMRTSVASVTERGPEMESDF